MSAVAERTGPTQVLQVGELGKVTLIPELRLGVAGGIMPRKGVTVISGTLQRELRGVRPDDADAEERSGGRLSLKTN